MSGHESSTAMPTQISREAWDAAMLLMEIVGDMLREAGYVEAEGRSQSTETVAKMVQHAINRVLDRTVRP